MIWAILIIVIGAALATIFLEAGLASSKPKAAMYYVLSILTVIGCFGLMAKLMALEVLNGKF